MLVSFHLEIMIIWTQGKCTVCAKRTIDLEIILDTPDALLGDEAQVEARFSTFGDSANIDAR
jgi:hypothetical protein